MGGAKYGRILPGEHCSWHQSWRRWQVVVDLQWNHQHTFCTKRDCASRRQQSSKNTCWSHASCTKYILFSWYRGVTGIATICEQISKWVRQTQNHLSIGEPVILALRFQVSVEIGPSPRGKSCQEDYVVTSQTENCVCELYWLEVGFTIHSYLPWNLEKAFKIIWLFEMT